MFGQLRCAYPLRSVLVVCCLLAAAQGLTVQVPGLGSVQGTSSLTAWTGRTVHEFRGLRYAQPPSGERRFKEPEKAGPWSGTLDAREFGQACPQPDSSFMQGRDSFLRADPEVEDMQSRAAARTTDPEDCLTLDVYSPSVNASALLPVLVYFHGGGFLAGSSSAHRPGFLLERDLVLVTPQYRLGVLGFFHLNTVDAPGNAGLADQLMALQWVRDNIAAFGGDPQKVTIAGISAGAASVSLHMLSPRSRGLFQRVIAQSGSVLAQWAVDESKGEYHSRAVARVAQCDFTAPPADLATCMRGVPIKNIMQAFLYYSIVERKAGHLGMGASQPTLQRAAEGVSPMVAASPAAVLASGDYDHVPLLMGVSRHEGIFVLDVIYQFYLAPNALLQKETFLRYDFLPTILNSYGVLDNSGVTVDALKKRFFDSEDLGNFTKMMPGLIDLTGAMTMKGPSQQQAQLHSSRAPTFFYTFDYAGNYSVFSEGPTTLPVTEGITHADDTLYLFPRPSYPLNEEDTAVAKRMIRAFANFVIAGDPSPSALCMPGDATWPVYDREGQSFLSVGPQDEVYHDLSSTYTVARTLGLAALSSKQISRGYRTGPRRH